MTTTTTNNWGKKCGAFFLIVNRIIKAHVRFIYQQFHTLSHTASISILRWPIVVILNIDLDTKKMWIAQKRNDISFIRHFFCGFSLLYSKVRLHFQVEWVYWNASSYSEKSMDKSNRDVCGWNEINSHFWLWRFCGLFLLKRRKGTAVPAIVKSKKWDATLAKNNATLSSKVNHKLPFKIYTKICKEKHSHSHTGRYGECLCVCARVFYYHCMCASAIEIWCDDDDLTPNSSRSVRVWVYIFVLKLQHESHFHTNLFNVFVHA